MGDLKQSIYRFRQAEPEIFRAKLGPGLLCRGHKPACGRRKEQRQPWHDRAGRQLPLRPAGGGGINFSLNSLMTPQLGDTAYGGRAAPGLRRTGRVCRQRGGLFPGGGFLPRPRQPGWHGIFDLVQQGRWCGMAVHCGRCGTRIAASCCLPGPIPGICRGVDPAGHPWCMPMPGENLLDAPHIRPLVALLRVLDNPAQDVCLAAAMLGPLFGFTEDDLVRLRGGQRRGSL